MHVNGTSTSITPAIRRGSAAISTGAWQDAYPDADWHRSPAPEHVIPSSLDRLQHLEETAAADLAAEAAAARAELARTDTKAGVVLAFAGGAFSILAALVTLTSGLAAGARIGLGVGVALLAAAAAVALAVIRPSLPRQGGTGFVSHAEAGDAEQLLADLADDPEMRRARDVIRLSAIARTKYRRLRLSVDLLLTALVAVVISLAIGLL